MVHMRGVDGLGKLGHVARAFDVDAHLAVFIGAQVVDRGQVVDAVDLALQRLDVVAAHAQLLGGEVAADRHRPGLADAPLAVQAGQFPLAAGEHQRVHRAAGPRQQGLDKALADEAGGAGDEVMHAGSPRGLMGGFLTMPGPRPLRANPKPSAPAMPRQRPAAAQAAAPSVRTYIGSSMRRPRPRPTPHLGWIRSQPKPGASSSPSRATWPLTTTSRCAGWSAYTPPDQASAGRLLRVASGSAAQRITRSGADAAMMLAAGAARAGAVAGGGATGGAAFSAGKAAGAGPAASGAAGAGGSAAGATVGRSGARAGNAGADGTLTGATTGTGSRGDARPSHHAAATASTTPPTTITSSAPRPCRVDRSAAAPACADAVVPAAGCACRSGTPPRWRSASARRSASRM